MVPAVRVAEIAYPFPSTDAECDAAIDAALVDGRSHGSMGAFAICGAVTREVHNAMAAARTIAARAAKRGIVWRHLLEMRVDIAADFGGGCALPSAFLRLHPHTVGREAREAWIEKGYVIRHGHEPTGSRAEWLDGSLALRHAFYAAADHATKTLWLQAIGINLADGFARAWIAERLATKLNALRALYGTPTFPRIAIKSGALCTSGWRFTPAMNRSGPIYLVGGVYQPGELGGYLREITSGVDGWVSNETPEGLERGALWDGAPPANLIGDGVFA